MLLKQYGSLLLMLLLTPAHSHSIPPDSLGISSHKHINNISYAGGILSGLASIFSPRMDFDQWKPLTGRGDPLRNDPTYDYEPPVLERVHYWADDTRPDREDFPERKSEVLMLGVSSRKPSVTPRLPPPHPRRPTHQHQRPPPPKYEDFTFKINEHYPMTILVPPPPPPPGHQQPLFTLNNENFSRPSFKIPMTESPPVIITQETTSVPEHLTSLYALQEANLIYQSSTTHQNWNLNTNQTRVPISGTVSSDYAGWGPTTPLDEIDVNNETHNLITNDPIEHTNQPYKFYRPMLSEAPPPPSNGTPGPLRQSTFLPTALPPTVLTESTTRKYESWPTEKSTYELYTENLDYYEDTTTEKSTTIVFEPTPNPPETGRPETDQFDMLGPMLSMPLVNGPERPEDNLYAHASENNQVYRKQTPEDIIKLETMQTMLPPPVTDIVETTTNTYYKQSYHPNAHSLNSILLNNKNINKPSQQTPDPYLHMRFTTPITTPMATHTKSSTEAPSVPMYLIIQGHSKVKTYSSKPKPTDEKYTLINDITKPNETSQVKHLHPIKDKYVKKIEKVDKRTNRAYNLSSLIDQGLGSIEIQEADVGIKYDVSDGSNVPVEIYRKGIVDSDENNYIPSNNKTKKINRKKRQLDLEDLLPFDEDSIEEYVYNFFEGKKNETGITGLIAQAVTSDTAAVVDELDDDDDDNKRRRRRIKI